MLHPFDVLSVFDLPQFRPPLLNLLELPEKVPS